MSRRIADIEVLRAVAVLFVIFQHAGSLFPWTSPVLETLYAYLGGTFGVDLFFAVSGFVIARDLIPRLLGAPDRATAWKTMLAFWLRRMWRLWPSAWLWLGLTLLAVLAFNRSGVFGGFEANLQATFAGIFQYANVRFAQDFMVREIGASFVYWSLSLEEQFYLLFPVLIVLFRRHLGWALLTVALIQICMPRQQLYLMMFRTDALALGILLALWSHKVSWPAALSAFSALGRWGCLLLALTCIGIMALLSGRLELTRYAIGIIAILSALLVLMASYDRDLLLPNSRFKYLLVWIGERSYAIYLIHVPAFLATRELFYRLYPEQIASAQLTVAYLVCATVMLTVLAQLNFRLLETPLRKYGAAASMRILQPLTRRHNSSVAAVPNRLTELTPKV
ncbi:acyltransferase family protein [Pseudomonas sp.]|uniref:acyltransferase family protein n=1 Tax=Pseudomonas sp. TaxID=306 RepID=UPI0035254960